MRRRQFLQIAPALPLAAAPAAVPKYRIVTRYKQAERPGMPGPYAGRVISVHAERAIDTTLEKPDRAAVQAMVARGMSALTGDKDPRDSWRRFFTAQDVVGIKVNCSGAPNIMSTPEVVGEIAANLAALGIPSRQIYVYERFLGQLNSVHYDRYLPQGVNVLAVEVPRGSIAGYDPFTYVEVDFFGEDDTRSNLVRLVSERFTKVINVPNMKDHGASGVTGCLKNIAYGDFSNVARSHRDYHTNTLTFIGTLAMVEPLRSRTVLQVMDGLRGVWHGGPFSPNPRFRFYPKRMMFSTDPVAIDRLLIDVIDNERKAHGAISVWDRSMEHLKPGDMPDNDPNVNHYIREPGHIEYAAGLGLGVYDRSRIHLEQIEL